MESISNRVTSLSPSATIAMNQKSRDLQAKGINVINLSVGEPDFFTPDHIKDAAKKAIDDNFSFYPPVPGFPDLLKAVTEKFKRENNLDYTPQQIIVSCGAKHSLANAMMSLVNKGDEVIIPAPYWVSYLEQVKLCEVFLSSSRLNSSPISKLLPVSLNRLLRQRQRHCCSVLLQILQVPYIQKANYVHSPMYWQITPGFS